jgi:hypothetical protein
MKNTQDYAKGCAFAATALTHDHKAFAGGHGKAQVFEDDFFFKGQMDVRHLNDGG